MQGWSRKEYVRVTKLEDPLSGFYTQTSSKEQREGPRLEPLPWSQDRNTERRRLGRAVLQPLCETFGCYLVWTSLQRGFEDVEMCIEE